MATLTKAFELESNFDCFGYGVKFSESGLFYQNMYSKHFTGRLKNDKLKKMTFRNVMDVNYKQVGTLKISSIALGTELLGSAIPKETTFGLFDRYLYHGGNCIDSARLYGLGVSEQTIGEWLKASGKRNEVILSTKGGHPDLKTMHIPRINKSELTADLDGSLKALGVDCIDVYWLHRDNKNVPAGEIIEVMNDFVKAGKVREIGASNWSAERVREANLYAKENGLKPFAASQIMWSLAVENDGATDPTMIKMTQKDYEIYKSLGLPVFGFASQGRGVFFMLQKGGVDALSPRFKEIYLNDRNLKNFETAQSLAQKHGIPLSAVILSYVHSNAEVPGLTIIGPRSVEQLDDSLSFADFCLKPEERELFV